MRKITLILAVLITLILITGCEQSVSSESTSHIPGKISPQAKQLEKVEIREYQGEKLGSIDHFRENSIKGPQYVDVDNYVLEITGLVEEPKTYTYEEVMDNFQSYEKVVSLDCVEGWSVKLLWEGVLVKEVIGKPLPTAKVVIFHAYDGYTTSFPVQYVYDNDIMIAYMMNNITLPPERGFPFQLVAESKWGYKWVKWITKIELSDDENYRGYWESAGYSNTGDLDKGYFED
ncbi:molybdopterin-dependent oxidoreductase [Nanoarchaeota archaeon]